MKTCSKTIISAMFFFIYMNWIQAQAVKDADGNGYNVVKIGTQVWLSENLKSTKLNDGIAITLVIDNSAWKSSSSPALCWFNNDAAVNKNKYGALYNWYAVRTNKLCPKGWHVPADAELNTLINFLGGARIYYVVN
jgi:uncharacterized protein (TIGR02145 family)